MAGAGRGQAEDGGYFVTIHGNPHDGGSTYVLVKGGAMGKSEAFAREIGRLLERAGDTRSDDAVAIGEPPIGSMTPRRHLIG